MQRRDLESVEGVRIGAAGDQLADEETAVVRSPVRLRSGGEVHEALAEKIRKPDLLVYLQASTDTLMQRIAQRDRPYERQMERSYIDELNRAYDSFYAKPFDGTPVLTIETDNLNFVQAPEHLKLIEQRIRQSLRLPPFQEKLPLPDV